MTTCLLLGASGALGRAVAGELASDYRLVLTSHTRKGPGFQPLDLREPGEVRAMVERARPDVVVLTAAYREPDFCEDHPGEARRLNVAPVQVLAEILPPDTRLVFISSDYVFDGTHPPYREDDPVCPVNEYGRTKCEAEALLRSRPRSLVVRPSVLCGEGPDGPGTGYGFIAQLLASLRDPTPQSLDDVLLRHPTWTRDVAGAIRLLLARGAEGVFHISGPRGLTRYGWTVELGGVLGLPAGHLRPSRHVIPRRARRPLDTTLNTDKLAGLGYPGSTDLIEVVRAVLPGLFH